MAQSKEDPWKSGDVCASVPNFAVWEEAEETEPSRGLTAPARGDACDEGVPDPSAEPTHEKPTHGKPAPPSHNDITAREESSGKAIEEEFAFSRPAIASIPESDASKMLSRPERSFSSAGKTLEPNLTQRSRSATDVESRREEDAALAAIRRSGSC